MIDMITRAIVAKQIAAWLHHDLSLGELVEWAENALLREDLADDKPGELAEVVARLAAADVRNFGLSWEDCEQLLRQLGYVAHVEITAA